MRWGATDPSWFTTSVVNANLAGKTNEIYTTTCIVRVFHAQKCVAGMGSAPDHSGKAFCAPQTRLAGGEGVHWRGCPLPKNLIPALALLPRLSAA